MSRCMCCKRNAQIFIVSLNESFTSWIFNLLGSVDQYLTPKRGICSSCLYLINNMLAVKRCLLHCITLDDTEENFVKNYEQFIKIYDTFLHNLQTTKFDIHHKELEAINNYHLKNNSGSVSNVTLRYSTHSPTSNYSEDRDLNETDLLLPMYSEPNKIEKSKRKRPYVYDSPSIDHEIIDVFRKKRRKRNDHIWTRRKKSINRSQSVTEPPRSNSVSLTISRPATSQSIYQIPTSTSMMYGLNTLARSDIIYDSFRRFTCIEGCREAFNDLTALTRHKMEHHKLLAKFWCYECHLEKFTSERDLNIHKLTTHKVVLSHCLLCSEVLPSMLELKYHLLQHKKKSVPCLYCDKTFLSEKICKIHIEEYHKNMEHCEKRINVPVIKSKFNIKPPEPPPLVYLKPGEVIFKELKITSGRNYNKTTENINLLNTIDLNEDNITSPTIATTLLQQKQLRIHVEDNISQHIHSKKSAKYTFDKKSPIQDLNSELDEVEDIHSGEKVKC